MIAAQRAQIDAEAAVAVEFAAAAEGGVGGGRGGGGGGRGRRPPVGSAAVSAAPRLSRTMIARLPTFDYADPPAGQESDAEDEDSSFMKGGDIEKGNAVEQPRGGGGGDAAAPPATKKKTFARSSSSGKRRCIVCLDPLSSEKVMALPCGHLFHSACVGDWLERHATCPECRTEITSSLISALGDDDEEAGGVGVGLGSVGGEEQQQQQQQAIEVETGGDGGRRSHRRHHHYGRRHR